MNIGTFIIGIVMVLILVSMINYVTIPAIYSGAEGTAEGLNDMGENGATGDNIVQIGGSLLWIYVVGWVGSIFCVILTAVGFVIALKGLV